MYKISDVFDGEVVELHEMLEVRERRQTIQKRIFQDFPEAALLSMTMNIPGEIKNSSILKILFDRQVEEIKKHFKDDILFERKIDAKTGNEAFYSILIDPQCLKAKMIELEEESIIGRLFDCDVLYQEEGEIVQISRTALGCPTRKCYLCHHDAKECGRNRTHSLDEMKKFISQQVLLYLES